MRSCDGCVGASRLPHCERFPRCMLDFREPGSTFSWHVRHSQVPSCTWRLNEALDGSSGDGNSFDLGHIPNV